MRRARFYLMVCVSVLVPVLGCDSSTNTVVPTNPEPPTLNPAAGSTTSGALQISVSTSGPDQDANGYTVSAQAPTKHQFGSLAANGRLTLADTEPGSVSVLLYGLAPNCNVTGANPRVVNVQVGATASVSFVVNCVASGSLRVTTVTTGEDLDADGYLMLDQSKSPASDIGHSFSAGLDFGMEANGTITASALAPGKYVVGINGVAPNCESAIPGVQTITIVAGVETSLRFEVKCTASTQIAFVRGAGREEWLPENIANTDIYVAKSDGTGVSRLTSQPGADINPAWSPSGMKIAFASDRAGNREIYVMNADGSEPVRLTDNAAADYLPAYSPDGARIAFVSERDGNPEIYVMNADGTNVLRLTNDASVDTDPEWSPDGSKIAFVRNGIVVMANDGSNLVRLTSSSGDRQPSWSPDARTILFSSSTLTGIYQIGADGSGITRVQGYGYDSAHPDWSPDGKQLAYDDRDCWDNGPCPRGIIIGKVDKLWSSSIDDASEPAWRPRF